MSFELQSCCDTVSVADHLLALLTQQFLAPQGIRARQGDARGANSGSATGVVASRPWRAAGCCRMQPAAGRAGDGLLQALSMLPGLGPVRSWVPLKARRWCGGEMRCRPSAQWARVHRTGHILCRRAKSTPRQHARGRAWPGQTMVSPPHLLICNQVRAASLMCLHCSSPNLAADPTNYWLQPRGGQC